MQAQPARPRRVSLYWLALGAVLVLGAMLPASAAHAYYTPSYSSPSYSYSYSPSFRYTPSYSYTPSYRYTPSYGYRRPGRYWVRPYFRRNGTYVSPYLRRYPRRY